MLTLLLGALSTAILALVLACLASYLDGRASDDERHAIKGLGHDRSRHTGWEDGG